MQLLQPAWLWGLLGLLLPLIIHMLHKRSRKVVMVGSLQAFRGGAPVQARRFRLNEKALLLLRCLLLALFVLLLAQPVLVENDSTQKRYVFIAPELAGEAKIDSLMTAGFAPHFLQPGLAQIDEHAAADTAQYSYWDVFREIDALQAAGDTVWLFFQPTINHFHGKRPQLHKTFEALPVQAAQVAKQLIGAVVQPEDQVLMQWWEEQEGVWPLKQASMPRTEEYGRLASFDSAAAVGAPDTIRIALQGDAGRASELHMWQQALQLIDSLLPGQAIVVEELRTTAEQASPNIPVWVWLAAAEPPAAFFGGGEGLRLYYQKGAGRQWFVRDTQMQRLYLVQHLLTEAQHNRVLLAKFLPELMQVLPLGQTKEAPPVLLSEAQWQGRPASRRAVAQRETRNSLEPWLWALLLLTFILERWLSLRK